MCKRQRMYGAWNNSGDDKIVDLPDAETTTQGTWYGRDEYLLW